MLRIIAGKHKNRVIPTLKGAEYRPSTSKVRAAIFSILNSGEFNNTNLFASDSIILDLFCGTGSLGFEALSRGAGEVTFIDINLNHLRTAKEFATLIGELDKTHFVNINVLSLPKATKTFDLIFVDPPYHKNLAPQAINQLIKGQWLKNGAILVVELAKTDDVTVDGLELIKEKVYGNSKLLILRTA